MADVKITKTMVLTAIKAIVENFEDVVEVEVNDGVVAIGATDIMTYCDTALEQIAAKNVKAKERAAEKKAAGDELRAMVLEVLTDELQTRDVITEQITGIEDITPAKVGARLTQLVAAGAAVKEQIKTEDGRKVMAYKLA